MKEVLNKLNQDSSHHTLGLNTFSLLSAVLTWAHLTDHLTWWAFPITLICIFVGWGTEIKSRDTKKSKTLSF
jgi:hypothetical protein